MTTASSSCGGAGDVTVVLVDARNVLRSVWPNIPEADALQLTCAWAEANEVEAVVVFDGRAPGGLVGEQAAGPRCRAVGTGSWSADDWIVREAEELAARAEPYWLVTSDRELRARAGERAERTIGGGSFARGLRV
jgi:hypothetical protein